MFAGKISPVQLNLASVVSDIVTVTVALHLSGSLTAVAEIVLRLYVRP